MLYLQMRRQSLEELVQVQAAHDGLLPDTSDSLQQRVKSCISAKIRSIRGIRSLGGMLYCAAQD